MKTHLAPPKTRSPLKTKSPKGLPLRIGSQSFALSERPLLMGILNITPDSFFDGGKYMEPASAVDHAQSMIAAGAHMIDIGAESSRPGAPSISIEEEWKRLKKPLTLLRKSLNAPISLDSWKTEIIKRSLDLGVDVVNDIKGLNDDFDQKARLIKEYGASVVIMHMRGKPSTMQLDVAYEDICKEIALFLRSRIEKALDLGIEQESIIADPGIGFGKSVDGNIQILSGIQSLKDELGTPILIGLSNKSFIRYLSSPNSNLNAPMAALHLRAIQNGADILRVHDIIDARNVCQIHQKLG